MERSVAPARELEALKRRTNDLWEEIKQVDQIACDVMHDLVEVGRRVDELRAAEQVDTRMPAIQAVTHWMPAVQAVTQVPSHVGEQGGGKRRRLGAKPMDRQDSLTGPDSQASHASESGGRTIHVLHDEVQGMERSGAFRHGYHMELSAAGVVGSPACRLPPEESLSWSSAEESLSSTSSEY